MKVWLADGTSVSTKVVWLNTLMVILILSSSNYTVTGYPGEIINLIYTIFFLINLYLAVSVKLNHW